MSSKKLNLNKFRISKLTGVNSIIGGEILPIDTIDTTGENNSQLGCYNTDNNSICPTCPQTTVTNPPTDPKCITSIPVGTTNPFGGA